MVPPGEGNEARGDGRRGVGVSHSTAEAGELSPRDPVEGRGHRQVAPVEGKTANTPRLGPVSTSRHRIAELARQALGMAVAIAWLPGPAGTRRRVAKPSVEEPDAAEPARPDLWGARVSNDPGLPDRQPAAGTASADASMTVELIRATRGGRPFLSICPATMPERHYALGRSCCTTRARALCSSTALWMVRKRSDPDGNKSG